MPDNFLKMFSVSGWVSRIGLILFLVFFPLKYGFYLGGDPFIMGTEFDSFLIEFPFSGIGIIVALIGEFLGKRLGRPLEQKQILWILGFVFFQTILTNFSLTPSYSVLLLIVWTIGLLVLGMPSVFLLNRSWKQLVLLYVLTIYSLIWLRNPEVSLYPQLLGAGWTWLIFSMHQFKVLTTRYLWSYVGLVLGGIVFSGWWSLLMTMLWLTSNVWLGTRKKMTSKKSWMIGLIISLATTIVLLSDGFSFSVGPLDRIYTFQQWLFGVGEGQYYFLFSSLGDISLDPDSWVTTWNGWIYLLLEKGLLGIAGVIWWLSLAAAWHHKVLPNFLFFCFLLLSPIFIASEQGILFISVLVFSLASPFPQSTESGHDH